ncbi:hypothetical protein [Microcoleus sp. D3_18a_C4]|uniref:hypothetical protein n=1 Tax=unclassified Microcoleus TaxID=2642155 RepID=UPI002FD75B55
MTRHDTPVEPLPGLVPVATTFNLWLHWELKPISLTLLLLARYCAIFSGIIELSPCHNVPVNNYEKLRELLQLLKNPEERSKRSNEQQEEIQCQCLRLILQLLKNPEERSNEQQERLKNELSKLLPNLTGFRKRRDFNILDADFDGLVQEAYLGFFKTFSRFLHQLDLENTADDELRKRVVKRLNQIIKLKVVDYYRQRGRQPFTFSSDAPQTSREGEDFDSEGVLDDTTETGIEQLIEQEQSKNKQRIGRKLWQYIEDDPDGKLRNSYPDNKPEANCQVLARRLLLKDPPDKFSVIAKELNINYQTFKSHWKRTGLPLVKEIALKFGYQPEE